MSLMGPCCRCSAQCIAVAGSEGERSQSRGSRIAGAEVTGRRLGYVIEGREHGTERDTIKLICRECASASLQAADAA